jgi:hypothetical protein
MVPQKIEFLNEIPLTHSGKIDRMSLRNQQKSKSHKNQGHTPDKYPINNKRNMGESVENRNFRSES